MKMHTKGARAVIAALALALAAAAAAVASYSPDDGLATAKAATSRYADLSLAKQSGYGLLKDKNGIACIAMDPMPGMTGAMGVHYANPKLVGDGVLDVHTPEVLVYKPVAGRQLRLAAVEYVVIKSAWDAKHNGAPVMFGHRFNSTPAGNRFGLPAFYSLHVWLFARNPSGEFSMWNPTVSCKGLK